MFVIVIFCILYAYVAAAAALVAAALVAAVVFNVVDVFAFGCCRVFC